jgi:hypothetical protein
MWEMPSFTTGDVLSHSEMHIPLKRYCVSHRRCGVSMEDLNASQNLGYMTLLMKILKCLINLCQANTVIQRILNGDP